MAFYLLHNYMDFIEYIGVNSITVNNEEISLKSFCNNWLQSRINAVIEDIKTRLNLSDTVAKNIRVHYLGGGAKLLKTQLIATVNCK